MSKKKQKKKSKIDIKTIGGQCDSGLIRWNPLMILDSYLIS